MTTEKSIEQLIKALNEDANYRQSWVANLAMAFYDESVDFCKSNKKQTLNQSSFAEVGNRAAERFLNQLTSK